MASNGGLFGTVFDIQRMSVHDGPGIRTTVFLKGCPLHCGWCHNPESQIARPELGYFRDRCIGCGQCVSNCPSGTLRLVEGKVERDSARCLHCMTCSEVCPSFAWRLYGRNITVEELCRLVLRDLAYYESTGGGVTFSGGEPLCQSAFVQACELELKRIGVHTALETSAYGAPQALRELAETTDLFLADIKIMDSSLHRYWTGVPVEPVLDNIRLLSELGARVLVRVPVAGGINDTEENMERLAAFLTRYTVFRQVELLRLHKLAKSKYGALWRDYAADTLEIPSGQRMVELQAVLCRCGIDAKYGDHTS